MDEDEKIVEYATINEKNFTLEDFNDDLAKEILKKLYRDEKIYTPLNMQLEFQICSIIEYASTK
jgi:uncharacterized protein Yka (UPF0111/DUF47 family)